MTQTDFLKAIKDEVQIDRHLGPASNYLYADGHVETIPDLDVIQWTEQSYNFAKVY